MFPRSKQCVFSTKGLYHHITILIHDMVSQFEISTNYLPPPWIELHKTQKPYDNNLFLYYTTTINHNVKHMLENKTITTFVGVR